MINGFKKQKNKQADKEMIKKFLGIKETRRNVVRVINNKIEKVKSQMLNGRSQLSRSYLRVSQVYMVKVTKARKSRIRKVSIQTLILNISSHFS